MYRTSIRDRDRYPRMSLYTKKYSLAEMICQLDITYTKPISIRRIFFLDFIDRNSVRMKWYPPIITIENNVNPTDPFGFTR
jgi:hypothetical protein